MYFSLLWKRKIVFPFPAVDRAKGSLILFGGDEVRGKEGNVKWRCVSSIAFISSLCFCGDKGTELDILVNMSTK